MLVANAAQSRHKRKQKTIRLPYESILKTNPEDMVNRLFCSIFAQISKTNPWSMIKVSEDAKKRIASLMTDEGYNAVTDFVRVGVKSGGCSGLSYELKFDKSQAESDKLFEDNNVKIVVDKKSVLYLAGTILEYSGGLNGKGFVFNNPNAQRTCGCGESFSL